PSPTARERVRSSLRHLAGGRQRTFSGSNALRQAVRWLLACAVRRTRNRRTQESGRVQTGTGGYSVRPSLVRAVVQRRTALARSAGEADLEVPPALLARERSRLARSVLRGRPSSGPRFERRTVRCQPAVSGKPG